MTAAELQQRALDEAHELGPPPDDPTDRPAWIEERNGVVQLLSTLAGYDRALLRQAAELMGQRSDLGRDMLLEAADA